MAPSSDDNISVPLPYRLFFLYVEPISALVGAYYAAALPDTYLAYLSPTGPTHISPETPTATLISLYQLANLYLLFALNEALVLRSTRSRRVWRTVLFALLVADFGHLATMVPLGVEKGMWAVFGNAAAWSAMEWGSVGFVYAGASMRMAFLAGVGIRGARAGRKGQ